MTYESETYKKFKGVAEWAVGDFYESKFEQKAKAHFSIVWPFFTKVADHIVEIYFFFFALVCFSLSLFKILSSIIFVFFSFFVSEDILRRFLF